MCKIKRYVTYVYIKVILARTFLLAFVDACQTHKTDLVTETCFFPCECFSAFGWVRNVYIILYHLSLVSSLYIMRIDSLNPKELTAARLALSSFTGASQWLSEEPTEVSGETSVLLKCHGGRISCRLYRCHLTGFTTG